jgi:hypothetical protein
MRKLKSASVHTMRQTGCNLRQPVYTTRPDDQQSTIFIGLTIWRSPASLRSAKALTPIAFVQCILAAYTKYGIDPTQALEEAQITPDLSGEL